MECPAPQTLIFQTLTSSLQQIVSEITQIKSDFMDKLAVLSEQSTSVQRLVETMGYRLSRMERRSEDDSDMDSARTPETQMNCRKLKIEIQMLKEKVRVLSDENTMLRNGKNRGIFAQRPRGFEPSMSDDNHSLSSIQMADRSDQNKPAPVPQRIREFRLDSAPSQSFKPNSSLLSDPRVAKILNHDILSIKNSGKEVASLKTGRLAEIERNIGNVSTLERLPLINQTPSLSPTRSPRKTDETPVEARKTKPRQLTILNRRPPKLTTDKDPDEIGRTMATSADDKGKNLAGIKNFGDFRSLLKQMKDSISLTNYSLFNADVDKNIENLQTLFRDYSELQEKIEDLHLKWTSGRADSPGLSDSPDALSPVRGPGTSRGSVRPFPDCSSVSQIAAISRLRENVRLSAHKDKLAEVQGNPGHLESFLYRLKSEYECNLKEFNRISQELN